MLFVGGAIAYVLAGAAAKGFVVSYDLMVFDASAAPRERDAFMEWYDGQCEWSEDHGYDDVKVSPIELQEWFHEMRKSFPPMSGEFAPIDDDEDEDVSHLADYSIGREMIYGCFSWSCARKTFATVRGLAIKHRVGFFDVSANRGEILFPGDVVRGPKLRQAWWHFW